MIPQPSEPSEPSEPTWRVCFCYSSDSHVWAAREEYVIGQEVIGWYYTRPYISMTVATLPSGVSSDDSTTIEHRA